MTKVWHFNPHKFFTNITGILVVFFIIRLFGVTNPPLEVEHSWRQVTTNMYARNFLEIDNNILFARIDFSGYLSGITAKEFPVYNYLIYIISLLFGFEHWYGRLINLIFSTISIYFFYQVIKQITSHRTAYFSSIVLLCSIWFSYSRKILPDTFSMSLTIISIYYALQFLNTGKNRNLITFFLVGLTGTLSKIPSLYILGPFLIFAFKKYHHSKRFYPIVISSAIILLINIVWYFIWIPYITNKYGFVQYPVVKVSDGINQIFSNINLTLNQFYFNALKSFSGLAVFLFGIYSAFRYKNKTLIWVFVLGFLSFLPFIFKSGYNFYHHSYYIIPFVPVMAMLAGYGLSNIKNKYILGVILSFIVIESIANQQHDFFIKKSELYKLNLEQIADNISQPNDLIAIHGKEGNPQELYFTHRKGWVYDSSRLNTNYIERIASAGCKYLFINKLYENKPELDFRLVYEDNQYLVYDISD